MLLKLQDGGIDTYIFQAAFKTNLYACIKTQLLQNSKYISMQRYLLKYRVSRVKLENCRWFFETENMDRFLIKRYFYYCKGGKFYMGPQKFRKKIPPGTQNLCQSHNIQYIKLKENGNFKMGNLALTDIFSTWRELFLNFCGIK